MATDFRILEALDVGVDWVTATIRPGPKMTMCGTVAERWYEDRQNDGWQGKAWKWNGYSGSTCDGISFGRRDDGLIVRLSGRMASMHWRTLCTYADNVSRFDLQVTGQDERTGPDWHDLARHTSSYDYRIANGSTRTTYIASTPSGGTYAIGSRSSDKYLRVYDKTAESEGEYPERCWRWEVEYKAALANSVASKLNQKIDVVNAIIDRVRKAFNDYLVTVPVVAVSTDWKPGFLGQVTDDQRRLQWLKRCIRPMVEKMSQSFDVDTLAESLGFHWVEDADLGTAAVYILHGPMDRTD